ncbi:MAG TPA: sensor histidine kinase [Streptosporangiaceae bacterium]|nr:sensor histidine kinase [Streptosporangiaceae bacterium]
MQAVQRLAAGDEETLADFLLGIAGAGLTAVAAWGPFGSVGIRIAGPTWLLVLLPVLVGGALTLRRRAPLVMWTAIWAGIAVQYVITRHPPQNLEFTLVLLIAAFSLGAQASLRRAAAGLGISVLLILASEGALLVLHRPTGTGGSPYIIPVLACWLAGVVVRARRQTVALTERNAALQRLAGQAAAAERVRIARELHDIVAHHLSVVVLQAAGARASGLATEATLAKIENNGRQALAETRRLLGVLREDGQETGLGPQPGVGELATLADTVRAAGLPVDLDIDGDPAALPAAVDLSVYRIVQEALTNVLKHAGPARAQVTIGCADEAVTIEVTDDGTRAASLQPPAGGHGLAGMRERAAIFGGELQAGPRPGGGFAVRARLPLRDPVALGHGRP